MRKLGTKFQNIGVWKFACLKKILVNGLMKVVTLTITNRFFI